MPQSEHETGGTPPIMDIDRVIHAPARLLILSLLYVVESADYVFLMRQTGLTWGNLSTHMSKLEKAAEINLDYLAIETFFYSNAFVRHGCSFCCCCTGV